MVHTFEIYKTIPKYAYQNLINSGLFSYNSNNRGFYYADFEKLFSFRLPESGLRQLATISERYLIHVVERRIPTLEFYHQIASMGETI